MTKYKYDQGYSWFILLTSLICNMVFQTVPMSSSLFMVNFIQGFDISTYYAGWICSIHSSLLAIGALGGGVLIDKFSCKTVGFVGAFVGSMAVVVASQAENIIVFFLCYSVISAIFISFTRLSPIVIIQYYFDKKRPMATGIGVLGYSIGIFGLLPVIAFLIEYYGWRGAMMIIGAFFLQMCVCCLTFTSRKSSPKLQDESVTSFTTMQRSNTDFTYITKNRSHSLDSLRKFTLINTKVNNNTNQTRSSNDLSTKPIITYTQTTGSQKDFSQVLNSKKRTKLALFKNANFLMVASSFTIYMFSSDIMFKVMVPKIELDMKMTKIQGSAIVSAISLASLISQILTTCIANFPFVNITVIYAAGILIGGVVMVVFTFVYSYNISLALGFVYGLCYGMTLTVNTTLLVNLFGVEHVARSQGIILATSGISYIVIFPFSGWMYDNYGSFTLAFFTGGILQCIGGLISVILYLRTRNKRHYADVMMTDVVNSREQNINNIGDEGS